MLTELNCVGILTNDKTYIDIWKHEHTNIVNCTFVEFDIYYFNFRYMFDILILIYYMFDFEVWDIFNIWYSTFKIYV